MRRLVVLAAIVAVLSGCVFWRHYYRRNYEVGAVVSATIGSPILTSVEGAESNHGAVSSFERQLIYSGKAGTVLRFSYREFSTGLARPAFTQDVQYDLKESAVLAFQAIRMEVLASTNEQITVRVLAAEPSPATEPSSIAQPGPQSGDAGTRCAASAECRSGVCISGACR